MAETIEKKYVSLSKLEYYNDLINQKIVQGDNSKADINHEHITSDITDLQSVLDTKVSNSITINEKPLSSNITLTASDVHADSVGSSEQALTNAKSYTDEIAELKSDVGHNHNDLYYGKGEIDGAVSDVNTSISNIINGTTPVQESNHSLESDSAINATNAVKAIQDGSSNIITDTYETKIDASAKLESANSYTDTKIGELVGSAPEALDTVYELATALKNNPNVVDALNESIATKADKAHGHEIADVTNLQDTLDLKTSIYYGSGECPEWANVQIDESATPVLYDPIAKTADMTTPVGVDADGRLYSSTPEIPELDYVPNSEKGVASGVASLGTDGKVPLSQLPTKSSVADADGTPTVTITSNSAIYNYGNYSVSKAKYYIRNGVCYVLIELNFVLTSDNVSVSNGFYTFTGLPKPISEYCGSGVSSCSITKKTDAGYSYTYSHSVIMVSGSSSSNNVTVNTYNGKTLSQSSGTTSFFDRLIFHYIVE